MKPIDTFHDYVIGDVLGHIDGITSRKMFGGYGIYLDGTIFSIITADGELRFKANDETKGKYEELGGKQFIYTGHLPAQRPDLFFVYVLRCADDSLYIGQTEDLRKRYEAHLNETGAVHTKKYKPQELIHVEEFKTRDAAVKREKELKTGFGRKWLKREYESGRARQAGKNKNPTPMPYWQVPEEIMEDREKIEEWAREAAELSKQNKK